MSCFSSARGGLLSEFLGGAAATFFAFAAIIAWFLGLHWLLSAEAWFVVDAPILYRETWLVVAWFAGTALLFFVAWIHVLIFSRERQ